MFKVNRKWGLYGAAIFLLATISASVFWWLKESPKSINDENSKLTSIHYVALEPPLIFNVKEEHDERWVQIALQLIVNTEKDARRISQHTPLLNSHLLSAFKQMDVLVFTEKKGHQRIKQLALSTINEGLRQVGSDIYINQVLLTQFVMQ